MSIHYLEVGYKEVRCHAQGDIEWSEKKSYVTCDDCICIQETEGVRQNEGKPMLSPIDPRLLLEMGKGLAIGQAKYGEKAFNKEGNVMKLSTGYDSLLRHLIKFMSGEDIDADDGVHHLAKVINCAVVMWHNKEQGDDRLKG